MRETEWRTFYRIEPDPRDPDPTSGASVPLGDPLWLLGRQWWVGEMDYFDGGTPVAADMTLTEDPIIKANGTDISADALLPSATLGAGQDAESSAKMHWRDRMRLGQSLVAAAEHRGLGAEMAQALVAQVPLGDRHPILLRMAPERRIDGARALDLILTRDIDLSDALRQIAAAWAKNQPAAQSFDTNRRTHTSGFETQNGARLTTDRAAGPDLHWSDLDIKPSDTTPRDVRRPLARASLPGQQPPRWWRRENAALDWVATPAGPSDLGQLLIAAAFAEQGQVQWRCEIDVSLNAIVGIKTARVTDTFGAKIEAFDARDKTLRGWCNEDGLMPILARAPLLRGDPLEVAVFRTDAIDNLAWLEETVVRNAAGRAGVWRPRPANEEVTDPVVAVRKAPARNWHPYRIENGKLRWLPLDDGASIADGKTRFLQDTFTLSPTEIGARGFRYVLSPMLGRAPNGQRLSWTVAHAIAADRASSSSGLLHDTILRPQL